MVDLRGALQVGQLGRARHHHDVVDDAIGAIWRGFRACGPAWRPCDPRVPGLPPTGYLSQRPVVDITEAAAHLALLVAPRYAVLTSPSRTIVQIQDGLSNAGVLQNRVGW